MRAFTYKAHKAFTALFIDLPTDFDEGVTDCKAGWAPKHDASKDYLAGYGEQYEREARIGGFN